MAPLIIIAVFIVLAIIIRMAAGGLDHDRVRQYVESRGGRVIDANWAPFGKGWFGEKNDRIYEVRYLDRDGNEHEAHCKTSLLSGVYFTEDHITRPAPSAAQSQARDDSSEDLHALAEENRRLREEVERLRRGES